MRLEEALRVCTLTCERERLQVPMHGLGSCLAALDEVKEPARHLVLEVLVDPCGGAHEVLGVVAHLLSFLWKH